MDINKSLDLYCDISRKYAKSEILKRCIFEITIHNELFDNKKYSFNDFVSDIYCPYIYSKSELKKIYKQAKKMIKNNKKND